MSAGECPASIRTLLATLGIPLALIASRSLTYQPDAANLVDAETDDRGRTHLLIAPAAAAWNAMKRSAAKDGIAISIVSAFRSIDRQAEIVRAKLARGLPLETILATSAPPGFSEHHTGRAVDISTDGVRPLEEEFEQTAAFVWLSQHAAGFGFSLSYPRGNSYGYAYEPWHWCFQIRFA